MVQRKRSHQDSDSGSDTDKDSQGKKGTTQWIAQLERDNKCEEHPDNLHGCMKLQDRHVPFTKDVLTGWAMYLVSCLVNSQFLCMLKDILAKRI